MKAAMRSMTQKAATLPIAYGGTTHAHAGCWTSMRRVICRVIATAANTEIMKSNWPASTPTLKNSSAMGIDACGNPISASAPAKPKPCNRPKVNATTHGYLSVRLGRPRRLWVISDATNTMLNAIVASMGGPGRWTTPSVAPAN